MATWCPRRQHVDSFRQTIPVRVPCTLLAPGDSSTSPKLLGRSFALAPTLRASGQASRRPGEKRHPFSGREAVKSMSQLLTNHTGRIGVKTVPDKPPVVIIRLEIKRNQSYLRTWKKDVVTMMETGSLGRNWFLVEDDYSSPRCHIVHTTSVDKNLPRGFVAGHSLYVIFPKLGC